MGEMSLVEMYLEPTSFSGRCNLGVSAPSCCDFILRVTVEEVPGHQDLSCVDWEFGVFQYVE